MNSKGESGGDARIMQSTDSYFLQLSVIRFQSISDQAGESQKREKSHPALFAAPFGLQVQLSLGRSLSISSVQAFALAGFRV